MSDSDPVNEQDDAREAQARVVARGRAIAEQLALGGARGNQVLWVSQRQGLMRRPQIVRGPHYGWPVSGISPPPGHELAGRTLTMVLRNDGELRLAELQDDGRLVTDADAGRPELPDAELWQEIEERLERLAREHHLEPS